MSTTLGSQDQYAETMDRRQEAADASLRKMLAEVTFEITPEFYAALEQLMRETQQDLEDVYWKAIALYKTVVDLKRQGKHVGVTDDPANLDREFVGLGSPESGL